MLVFNFAVLHLHDVRRSAGVEVSTLGETLMKDVLIRRSRIAAAIAAASLGASASFTAIAQDDDTENEATSLGTLQITGSRILREDYSATSKTTSVGRDELDLSADITLDQSLNYLPEVVPSATITSNNPGRDGQAVVDLRGLGSNRNLVLIDGRRPMVSGSDQVVDLNTIPAGMIERVEIITGGAGAVYGADAVSGVVNIITKKNYTGFDLRASYRDTHDPSDAMERQITMLLGDSMFKGKGSWVASFDYADRERLTKAQRPFAGVAQSITSFLPEGSYRPSGNAPDQAAVDALFAGYLGRPVNAGEVPSTNFFGFNLDGTLFSVGSQGIDDVNALNFRYPIDSNVNTNFFPDLYSYNFDAVNSLVLPLEKYSGFGRINYELDNGIELFGQATFNNYLTIGGELAPTPVPTVFYQPIGGGDDTAVETALIERRGFSSLIVPVTNPFIPGDLANLLATRTGDNDLVVGTGATEPLTMRWRTLPVGNRVTRAENTVHQVTGGAKGMFDFAGRPMMWEINASRGLTKINGTQFGNINTQLLQNALEAADGGRSFCTGGVDPFGRNPLSADCIAKLQAVTEQFTRFEQEIAQGFITGDIADLKYGPLSVVAGLESRSFEYKFVPGAVTGPISGFNTQSAAAGTNSFRDIFMEARVPVLADVPFVEMLEVGFGYRLSRSEFEDQQNNIQAKGSTDSAYKFDLIHQIDDVFSFRSAYQRSVRAPNFGELFAGGGSAPFYVDPCAANTVSRSGSNPDAAELRQLCIQTGVDPAGVDTFGQGNSQISINFAGNTDLQPETATTFTAGFVLDKPFEDGLFRDLVASIDYYQIRITDAIGGIDPNAVIADCYNTVGGNPTYDEDHPTCQIIGRNGGDIETIGNPGSGTSTEDIVTGNVGTVETSGLDFQVDYKLPMTDIGLDDFGALSFNLKANHILESKQQFLGAPGVDFAGTVASSSLGFSFPDWKASFTTRWDIGMFSTDVRMRYVSAMTNGALRYYPRESANPLITSVDAVTYFDIGASWRATDTITLRAGLQNAFDKQPPVYQPNVQSGTDPSLYDVLGRQAFLQLRMSI